MKAVHRCLKARLTPARIRTMACPTTGQTGGCSPGQLGVDGVEVHQDPHAGRRAGLYQGQVRG
jgi:hypothetical protein